MDQRRLLYWCGDAWKEHLSFMFVSVLLWSGIYSGSCTGTRDKCFPQRFSLGGILEGYSDCTPGGIRGKQRFNSEELGGSQDAIRSTPGASPPCLSGRTRRDEYVIYVSKGQTKSDQERKTLV